MQCVSHFGTDVEFKLAVQMTVIVSYFADILHHFKDYYYQLGLAEALDKIFEVAAD